MIEAPISKIICDTTYGDGGLYFYEDFFEWMPRSPKKQEYAFKVRYDNISDIQIVPSRKKQISVITKDNQVYKLYMYNAQHFQEFVANKINNLNKPKQIENVEVKVTSDNKEELLSALERLADLHEKNALTDEEFKAAKAKLLGL